MTPRVYEQGLCSSECPGGPRLAERIVRLETQHAEIMTGIQEIKADMVVRHEFTPVARLVYGATGLALIAVAGAILSLVVNR